MYRAPRFFGKAQVSYHASLGDHIMSYAGTTSRSRSRRGRGTRAASDSDNYQAPNGRDPSTLVYEENGVDWGRVAAFAAGILVGALAGASTAFLTAPYSGWETRDLIARRANRARVRAADAWDDWGYDMRRKARRTRRRAREAMHLG